MDKYGIILAAEEQFARAVALGLFLKRPLSVWHYLLPGMFIIGFLRRGSSIRKYSDNYTFHRKQALDAGKDILEGQGKADRLLQIEGKISDWLASLNLYSEELHRTIMKVVDLLVEHYKRLLEVEGDTYDELIRNGYKNREQYQAYLSRLTLAEKEVDKMLLEKSTEDDQLGQRILAEQEEVARRRTKSPDQIF